MEKRKKMGCLRNIIRAFILMLAAVGFISLGGKDLIAKYVINGFNPPQEIMLERAKKVGDFSDISDEFELERAAGILGYNAVAAEHKTSGQKFFVVDTKNKQLITKEDLQSADAEERLKKTLSKFKYQTGSIEELNVTKRGTLMSYGKTAPYIKFEARIKKFPIGEISGIISTVDNAEGDSRILISVNEKNKYSQLITDEFFKKIK